MTEIAVAIVGKVAEFLVAPIWRQFGYLCCCNRNIENMRSQDEKLKKVKLGVQEDVEVAIRNGDKIRPNVTAWLTSVNENEDDTNKILEAHKKVRKGCLNGWCPNVKSVYLLTREASKKTQKLIELVAEGRFENVAHPSTPRGIVHTPPSTVENPVDDKSGGFESRSLIMRDVMESLKDDKVRVIGIWGMGGVGKTTMAKEVVERVKKEGAFDEVVMVVVSQEPNLKKVQGDIAELLGLTLEEESLYARAGRLHKRLTQKGLDGELKKILVILDDVWARLDLEEVGIPSANIHNDCKILLTSRENDVCYQMRTDKTYRIEVLTRDEARDLFQKIGGISPDFLLTIAEEIVDECKGLPIAIITIARVLGNKSESTWKKVLRQLKMSALDGEYAVVYETFQVSYDFLQTEEVKDFFMLCCLFPEDFDVPVEDLVKYGVGLKIFQNITKLHDARENAHAHVETLKNSNLLLDSSVVDCVKVHDLVRDFALSRCKGEFLVKLSDAMEWPVEDMNERCTSISLQCNKMIGIPNGLNCPNLKLLRLAGLDYNLLKFPEIFFESMSKLHVLVLTCVSIRSLPSSLQFLSSLRTLSLSKCKLDGDISLIGNLEALELLSFAHSEIQDLPIEIEKLSRLRLLDLTGSKKLNRIAPHILSSLIHLEELYLRGTSIRWAEQMHVLTGDGVEKYASFAELKSLSSLVVLEIDMSKTLLPLDLIFIEKLEKLEKFYICVGNINQRKIKHGFPNTLRCKVDMLVLFEGVFNVLCKKTEVLHLSVNDLKSLQKEIDRECFLKLRDLDLTSCDEMVSLCNTIGRRAAKVFPKLESLCLRDMGNLEHIYRSQTSSPNLSLAASSSMNELALFGNLKRVQVTGCNKLRSIFSISIAKGLVNLIELEVIDCQQMEEVFMKERGEEDKEASKKIVFLGLEHLRLHNLPNFIGFCKTADEIELPQLEILDLKGLPRITSIYSKGDTLDSNLQQTSSNHPFFFKKVNTNNMARLELMQMDNMKEIWPVHFRNNVCLSKLEIIRVESCDNLLNVLPSNMIQGTEIEATASPIKLFVGFHKLREVVIIGCGRLRNVFPSSIIARGLVMLESLHVYNCEMMDAILWKDEGEYKAQFPRLRSLRLNRLPNMVHFSMPVKFAQLENVNLHDLPKFKGFASNGVLFNTEQVHNLQDLTVWDCDSLEAVFELQRSNNEGHEVAVLTQLKHVHLRDLHNLRHLWRVGGPPHVFIQGGSLHNLTFLSVFRCDGLTHLFTPSIAKLVGGLDEVRLYFCRNLESIVAKEEEQEEVASPTFILFPQLSRLSLYDVPKLLTITAGRPTYRFGWSCLKSLEVRRCQKFFETWNDTTLQVALDKLETLDVRHTDGPIVFFRMILPNQQLQNLQSLIIYDCSSLKVVFDLQGGHELATTLIQLERVDLSQLPRLTHVWRMGSHAFIQGPFRNLSFLYIRTCSDLRHVFTPSTAKLLPGLEELEIRDCENLEEIVAKEESNDQEEESGIFILFPQLTQLSLSDLPKLFKITPKPYSLKWSSLKKLDVRNCDNFPGGDRSQVALDNLETLDVRDMDNLTVFFPTILPNQQLQNLQSLKIEDCSKLEVVFDLQGLDELINNEGHELATTLIQLKRVYLIGLRRLTHVWRGSHAFIQGPFRNLSWLRLDKCSDLRHVFTPSTAKLLPGLEELVILDCENLEEIVAKEDGEEDLMVDRGGILILFPQLTHLRLKGLPKLFKVTPKPYSLNWSSLKTLDVFNFDDFPGGNIIQVASDYLETLNVGHIEDLTIFFPTFLPNQQLQNLQSLMIRVCNSLEVVFDLQGLDELINNEGNELATTLIFQLKDVYLSLLPRLTHVWRMGSHAFIHGPFRNLSSLIIFGCSELRHVFTPSTAKLLPGLEELVIRDCENLEEIIAKEDREEDLMVGGGGILILFPRLTHLRVDSLPKLFKVTPKPYSLNWSSLKKLDVCNCDNFPGGDIIQMNQFQGESNFPSLRIEEIEEMDD